MNQVFRNRNKDILSVLNSLVKDDCLVHSGYGLHSNSGYDSCTFKDKIIAIDI